jgi:hypothetical protein
VTPAPVVPELVVRLARVGLISWRSDAGYSRGTETAVIQADPEGCEDGHPRGAQRWGARGAPLPIACRSSRCLAPRSSPRWGTTSPPWRCPDSSCPGAWRIDLGWGLPIDTRRCGRCPSQGPCSRHLTSLLTVGIDLGKCGRHGGEPLITRTEEARGSNPLTSTTLDGQQLRSSSLLAVACRRRAVAENSSLAQLAASLHCSLGRLRVERKANGDASSVMATVMSVVLQTLCSAQGLGSSGLGCHGRATSSSAMAIQCRATGLAAWRRQRDPCRGGDSRSRTR